MRQAVTVALSRVVLAAIHLQHSMPLVDCASQAVIQVVEASTSLASITDFTDDICSKNAHIAEFANNQSRSTISISKKINSMSEISNKTSKTAKELSDAGNLLDELKSQLMANSRK